MLPLPPPLPPFPIDVQESLVTHPHATPMVLTGMTYLAADVIAQRYEGNSLLEFKAERIARSTLTGLLVLGPLAHGYYTTQDEIILRIWPDREFKDLPPFFPMMMMLMMMMTVTI